jgi:hypothetical protein
MKMRPGIIACSMLAVSLTGAVAFAGVNGYGNKKIVSAPEPLALTSSGPSASLNSNGTLARGKGIVSTSRLSTGQYVVKTTRNITNCMFIATLGNPGDGVPGSGEVQTALATGTTDSLLVVTTNSSGTAADRSVMVHVVCK